MARSEVQYDGQGERLSTAMAPTVSAPTARFDPRGNKVTALAEAFGAAGPDLERLAKDREQKAIQEQALKIDAYKEQFLQDHSGGAVSAAQVKQRFPETVPIIAARVAESIGQDYGKKAMQGVIEEVMNNDALRLDTNARAAYIAQKKKEIITQIGSGNEFYLNGVSKSIDSELNQYENLWQRQTADYHQKVQAQTFAGEVEKALATGGGSLENLDSVWKQSSSLNNLERNEIVIKTATQMAFANNDPSLLDKIPSRFLNADTKKDVLQTKINIEAYRIQQFRNAEYMSDMAIKQKVLEAKQKMIAQRAAGKQVNPAEHIDNPEAFKFALDMQNTGTLPQYESIANAQKVRTDILNRATLYSGNDQNSISNVVLNMPGINPAEKEKLLAEVPTLIEGRIAMEDPAVKSVLGLRIDARLKALESSTSGTIATLQGRNLRSEVMATFDAGIRQSFRTFYETKKQWPTGNEKQAIIDRETEKAEKLLEELTRAGAVRGNPTGAPPRNPPAGGNVIDFNQLPPKR